MFLRVSRIARPVVHADDYAFAIGRAAALRAGTRYHAHRQRRHGQRARSRRPSVSPVDGISAGVLNMSTVKPLDRDAILRGRAASARS